MHIAPPLFQLDCGTYPLNAPTYHRSVAVLSPFSSPLDRLEEDHLVPPGNRLSVVNGFITPEDFQQYLCVYLVWIWVPVRRPDGQSNEDTVVESLMGQERRR